MGMPATMLFIDYLNDRYQICLDESAILSDYLVGQLYQDILTLAPRAEPTEVWDYLCEWFSSINEVEKDSIKPELVFDWEGKFKV